MLPRVDFSFSAEDSLECTLAEGASACYGQPGFLLTPGTLWGQKLNISQKKLQPQTLTEKQHWSFGRQGHSDALN